MPNEKIIKPDVVIELTEEQIKEIAPLANKGKAVGGMILGSVGLEGNTVALSFVPREIALEIINLALQKIGVVEDIANVNS